MGNDGTDTTTLVDVAIRPVRLTAPALEASLICVFTPDRGLCFEAYPISSEGLVVGRSPARPTDVCIDDQKASRRHAELRWLEPVKGHALIDLNSTNGTHLNDRGIEREILSFEDVIRIGNSLFVYCRRPPAVFHDSALFVGRSRGAQEVLDSLAQVAGTDLKVLLTGETGTGKELAAQILHCSSGRSGAFVPVNCGAFPGTLIESELFGYVKGAFSGAERSKEGLITSAHRGTLFLDEIGEFPLDLQPRLLRILHDQEVRRVGATQSEKVDVRFIAATNQDIIQMVEANRFRRDLLARLNEWPVHLPPLRERREDIPLLIRHFLVERQMEPLSTELDTDLVEHMALAPWPANVRELAASVARLTISIQHGETDKDMLLRQIDGRAPVPREANEHPREAPTRDELQRTMALFEGNVSGVARYYGKERQQVYRWLEHHGLKES